MNWLWFLFFMSLQTSESCQYSYKRQYKRQKNNDNINVTNRRTNNNLSVTNKITRHDPIISVLVKNNDEVMERRYNKSNYNEVLFYHVNDKCLISCEQESENYTLSWTQQADNVSFPFPSYKVKKITINITLDRFDHDTELRCTAFEDAALTKSVSNISFKFNNTQIDSSDITYPANSTTDPRCLDQDMQYVIINDKLHYDSSMYPNDTTKVCIHKDINRTVSSNIHITRRVTYMNYPKPEKEKLEKDHFENKSDNKQLWMAVGGTVAALTIFIIMIVIWKRKRKSLPDVDDPVYATAQEMNRVVYAELDVSSMTRESTFSPNREEVIPYAQVVGVLKPKKKN